MSTEPTNQKIDYAFEIRFVDDNIVQVFDIAAKRKQRNDNTLLLPTEYKQEDVLKGQLRYSKLVGSNSSSSDPPVAKDAFGFEDNGLPYEHIVTTKRSKNRTSTQRHTFFMMGGGDNESNATADTSPDDINDRNDSGTVFTETSDENLDDATCNIQQDDVEHQNNSIQKSPKPTQRPPSVIQQQQPVVIQEPTLPPAVKQTINHLQPIHNPAPGTYQSLTHSNVTIPATQDYTSITTVTNNSRNYMQQQHQPTKAPKRGCCCIIS